VVLHCSLTYYPVSNILVRKMNKPEALKPCDLFRSKDVKLFNYTEINVNHG